MPGGLEGGPRRPVESGCTVAWGFAQYAIEHDGSQATIASVVVARDCKRLRGCHVAHALPHARGEPTSGASEDHLYFNLKRSEGKIILKKSKSAYAMSETMAHSQLVSEYAECCPADSGCSYRIRLEHDANVTTKYRGPA